MLGPLCVGRAAFSVGDWAANNKNGQPQRVPDLWKILSAAISPTRKHAAGRITIADSKKLKLPSSSVRHHPLVHLERGILTMLGTIGEIPKTDRELFELLGAKIENQPWFQGQAINLPVGSDRNLLQIDSNRLKATMDKAQIHLADLKVYTMGVAEFNAVVREHRTKAATTAQLLLKHLHEIHNFTPFLTPLLTPLDHTRIVIDRQSGRTHYANLLSRVWDNLEIIEESSRASRYTRRDALGVLLVSKADDGYLPVSLASMAAKYIRELMMERFNQYWSTKKPGLKPTAGYVQDARRWLIDAEDIPKDREALVRIA